MKDEILTLLDQKGDLPSFPDVLLRLQEKIRCPDVAIPEIAKLIEADISLAGNILKIANSAFYSTGSIEISTLSAAINRVGLGKIRQLAFSLALTKIFTDSTVINHHKFWRHSLAVANSTQQLSRYVKNISTNVKDLSYLAGLMHDVGTMVFAYLIPDEYSNFLNSINETEKPIEKLEDEKFGIDHQELGALFMEKWWKMDDQVINTVRYHHFPFEGTDDQRRCEQLVNVANGICNNHGIDNGIVCYHEIFKEGAWVQLGLSLDDVEKILIDVEVALEQAETLLNCQ